MILMLDLISKFFLTFGRAEIILPLSILGYIFYDKNKWIRIIYIMLFATILVAYLKSIWQIPLEPWVKSDSWAFPSGHMFVACVFYIQISREMQKRWITNVVYIILLGVAYGLIQQRYHNISDVVGAVGFAILLLFLYSILINRKFLSNRPELLIIVLLPISIMLIILLPIIQQHILYTFAGLVGFSIVSVVHKSVVHKKLAISASNKR